MRGRATIPATAAFLLAAAASAADGKLFEAVEPHMGTPVRIQLYAANERRATAAFHAAFARIAQLEAVLSDSRPQSELNRICRTAVGRPAAAGADLFQVLAASQKLAEETGGAFDITMGPVIRLQRQAREQNRLPDAAALRDAQSRCGYRKIHLDPANRTVLLDQAGMQLDLGVIAKGYAADQALLAMAPIRIRSASVSAGGDLAVGDPPPRHHGWKIGIDLYGRAEDGLARSVELSNVAVSTSSDSEMGLTQPIAVTVVAPHGIDASGLAAAVSVLGADRGMEFIERLPDVAALLVTGEGKTARILESSRWRDWI
jgi:FAD:protein FMN transferase